MLLIRLSFSLIFSQLANKAQARQPQAARVRARLKKGKILCYAQCSLFCGRRYSVRTRSRRRKVERVASVGQTQKVSETC